MYVVSVLVVFCVILNFVLGEVLYKRPDNKEFYRNVQKTPARKDMYILPEPKYVFKVSVLVGITIGLYMGAAYSFGINKALIWLVSTFVFVAFLFEVTRKITINEGNIIFSRFFGKKKQIKNDEINGIYIYSYNKKFLKTHALTTKLVVVMKDDKEYKYTLASLINKQVLNMIKDVFGVESHKMFIAKRSLRSAPSPNN